MGWQDVVWCDTRCALTRREHGTHADLYVGFDSPSSPQLIKGQPQSTHPGVGTLHGPALAEHLLAPAHKAEALGIDYLLMAQRWWGSGEEEVLPALRTIERTSVGE